MTARKQNKFWTPKTVDKKFFVNAENKSCLLKYRSAKTPGGVLELHKFVCFLFDTKGEVKHGQLKFNTNFIWNRWLQKATDVKCMVPSSFFCALRNWSWDPDRNRFFPKITRVSDIQVCPLNLNMLNPNSRSIQFKNSGACVPIFLSIFLSFSS